ncbi:MAG: alpha/beta hydrolase-fold protein [Flavobacteriaceae bacterium]|nr:alpha/beta hydrolase-fold protein [Flavobacteriaceae bacterium]
MDVLNRFLLSLVFITFISGCTPDKKTVNDLSASSNKIQFKPSDIKAVTGHTWYLAGVDFKTIPPRDVLIWQPDTTAFSGPYRLLLMHDGQMLLDSAKTWNKQAWKVDQTLSRLMLQDSMPPVLLVGVFNIPNRRHSEYFPQKAFNFLDEQTQDSLLELNKVQNSSIAQFGFNADNYLAFLVEELIPNITASFPITGKPIVGGSSMGGLISMYAIAEYPEVFEAAMCLSTHWPGMLPAEENVVAQAFFDYMKSRIPQAGKHRFYFDFGTETLDRHYPQYQHTVDTIFFNKGFSADNFKNLKFEGAEHTEKAWSERLNIPLKFLIN